MALWITLGVVALLTKSDLADVSNVVSVGKPKAGWTTDRIYTGGTFVLRDQLTSDQYSQIQQSRTFASQSAAIEFLAGQRTWYSNCSPVIYSSNGRQVDNYTAAAAPGGTDAVVQVEHMSDSAGYSPYSVDCYLRRGNVVELIHFAEPGAKSSALTPDARAFIAAAVSKLDGVG